MALPHESRLMLLLALPVTIQSHLAGSDRFGDGWGKGYLSLQTD